MINRLLFIGIAGFWITMTTLLVRMQIAPRDSSLSQIPPVHILRVMFEHEQSSDLNVSSGGLRYGSIVVRPSIDPESGQRLLFYGGSTLLRASYLPHDRLSLEGQLTLDPKLQIRAASGSLSLREGKMKIGYTYDQTQKTFAYSLEEDARIVRSETVVLDRPGLDDLLRSVDIDPAIVDSTVASASAPTLTAHYSKFKYREEQVDAYCLVLKRENTTLAEIFVSQLGQILLVKTPFGLQLAPNELLP